MGGPYLGGVTALGAPPRGVGGTAAAGGRPLVRRPRCAAAATPKVGAMLLRLPMRFSGDKPLGPPAPGRGPIRPPLHDRPMHFSGDETRAGAVLRRGQQSEVRTWTKSRPGAPTTNQRPTVPPVAPPHVSS